MTKFPFMAKINGLSAVIYEDRTEYLWETESADADADQLDFEWLSSLREEDRGGGALHPKEG